MAAHTLNPSTQEPGAGDLCEASWGCRETTYLKHLKKIIAIENSSLKLQKSITETMVFFKE